MGRNKSFDETEALDKAVQQFWTHGYRATSVRDLERVMGLTTASLYNSFGDKKALFRRSLQRYLDLSTRRRIEMLDASDNPAVAIEAFLRSVVASARGSRDGCFLVNSAGEVAAHDEDIAAEVSAGLADVEAAVCRAVRRGQAEGTIATSAPAETVARAVVGTIVAIRTLSRLPVGGPYLVVLAETQIEALHRGGGGR